MVRNTITYFTKMSRPWGFVSHKTQQHLLWQDCWHSVGSAMPCVWALCSQVQTLYNLVSWVFLCSLWEVLFWSLTCLQTALIGCVWKLARSLWEPTWCKLLCCSWRTSSIRAASHFSDLPLLALACRFPSHLTGSTSLMRWCHCRKSESWCHDSHSFWFIT